jgi:hypothetical protein
MAQSEFNEVRGGRRPVTPATQPSAAAAPAPAQPPTARPDGRDTVTIKPEMPKPLFAGTPLAGPGTPNVAATKPGDSAARPAAPAAPVLKPAGRVSIPVRLFEEGTVHRFRKVNDRAALNLTIKPLSRSTASRWQAAVVLAAGLGGLWLANRLMVKRRPLCSA